MEPATFLSTVSSMETTRNTNRLGPLHTCANAMLTTAHKAYKKTETLPDPLGSTAQKLAKLVGPILYILQYQWLAILSFVDDQILTIEIAVETLFPPSTYVFDKIDGLVHVSKTLPVRFDNAVDKFPAIIRRVPCLNWASAQLIIILNFLVSTLIDWGVDGAKEKEITVDINSHDQFDIEPTNKEETFIGDNCTNHREVSSEPSVKGVDEENEKQMETYKEVLIKKKDVDEDEMGMKKDYETTTYKTILEMGMKKEEDKKDEEVVIGTKKDEKTKNISNNKKDTGGTTCRKRREEDQEDESNLNVQTCVKDFRSSTCQSNKFDYQRLKLSTKRRDSTKKLTN